MVQSLLRAIELLEALKVPERWFRSEERRVGKEC